MAELMSVDLAKASDEELRKIQNLVVRRITEKAALKQAGLAAEGHDSHGSVHSKNSIALDIASGLASAPVRA